MFLFIVQYIVPNINKNLVALQAQIDISLDVFDGHAAFWAVHAMTARKTAPGKSAVRPVPDADEKR